jgi:hypothetical protein
MVDAQSESAEGLAQASAKDLEFLRPAWLVRDDF